MILFVFVFALIATACTMATEHAVNGPESASRTMVRALVESGRTLILFGLLAVGAVWLLLLAIGFIVRVVGGLLGAVF